MSIFAGPSANPVSGIANCPRHTQHCIRSTYCCAAGITGIIDSGGSGQYWHSAQPYLNRKYSTFCVDYWKFWKSAYQYIDMSQLVLPLPHDFILTCAFPRGPMIGAIGCIWYLLSWYGFAPSRCKFSGSPNTLCSDHDGGSTHLEAPPLANHPPLMNDRQNNDSASVECFEWTLC